MGESDLINSVSLRTPTGQWISTSARRSRKAHVEPDPPVGNPSQVRSIHLLDIRQLPGLLEQSLGRSIEAEDKFEALPRLGRNPVRLLAGRRLGAEVDIDRAVVVLLHVGSVGS